MKTQNTDYMDLKPFLVCYHTGINIDFISYNLCNQFSILLIDFFSDLFYLFHYILTTQILKYMKTRRDFLKTTGALTIGSLLLKNIQATEKFKNVGIQLYTFRKEMAADAIGT